VEHCGEGYRLTAEARSLVALIMPLHEWAEGWASKIVANAV
jgi:DNA-binding HxlR family transcriptional regulator